MKIIILATFTFASLLTSAAQQVCQYNGQYNNEVIFLTINLDEQSIKTLEYRSSLDGISYLSTVDKVEVLGTVTRYSGELSSPWAQNTSFQVLVRQNHSGIFRVQKSGSSRFPV
jgi:hypothetical protein